MSCISKLDNPLYGVPLKGNNMRVTCKCHAANKVREEPFNIFLDVADVLKSMYRQLMLFLAKDCAGRGDFSGEGQGTRKYKGHMLPDLRMLLFSRN